MTKISATILTHNEASRIEACLESLRDVADEIVVVDSFSTDNTVEICHRYGCRVTRRHIAGFGAQRQYATSLTAHSYVLAIDADEALSPTLRQSLLTLKERGCRHRGYMMARLNFFCGYAVKHSGWYPDYQVRLFDKRYASWSLRDVNEQVQFRDDVKPELLAGDLLHYRCSTPEEYLLRCMKQADVRARSMADSDEPIAMWTPALRGVRRFFISYLAKGGILDGSVGLAISRRQFVATRYAFSQARRMRRKRRP